MAGWRAVLRYDPAVLQVDLNLVAFGNFDMVYLREEGGLIKLV